MYKAVAGHYVLWFLLVLAAGKIIACSTTLGIGGSGGVFAPSLFVGATSGHGVRRARQPPRSGRPPGQPALYAVVAMGAVFASAARAPLTSVASVVEMTGDFTLTLPVMLAVAIATATSRALSYGTIYTTKLLRPRPGHRPRRPVARLRRPQGGRRDAGRSRSRLPCRTATQQLAGQELLPTQRTCPVRSSIEATRKRCTAASPSPRHCASSGLRPRRPAGAVRGRTGRCRAGSPTPASCRPSPAQIGSSPPRQSTANGTSTAGRQPVSPGPDAAAAATRSSRSQSDRTRPAIGEAAARLRWPPSSIPVSVLRQRSLREPDPDLTLADGDRVSLLAPVPAGSPSAAPGGERDGDYGAGPARSQHWTLGRAGQ